MTKGITSLVKMSPKEFLSFTYFTYGVTYFKFYAFYTFKKRIALLKIPEGKESRVQWSKPKLQTSKGLQEETKQEIERVSIIDDNSINLHAFL